MSFKACRLTKERILRINQWLLTQPVGTKIRLGNALLEHIPRSLSATLSDPEEDGYVDDVGGQNTAHTSISIGKPGVPQPLSRGYVEWDISGIPSDAIITETIFRYEGDWNAGDAHIHAMAFQPTMRTAAQIYTDCGDGATYAEPVGFPVLAQSQSVDLGAGADIDVENQIGVGWFAIGIQADNEGPGAQSSIASEENLGPAVPPPTLYVEYSIPTAPANPLISKPLIARTIISRTRIR